MRDFQKNLLAWYDAGDRDIPWRVKGGHAPDPYKIWLSEIMCQQTTVAAVKPYYARFLELWPDVHVLARAKPEAIMKAWAGLGYYARARNLHACAKIVSNEMGGVFPQTAEGLMELPGIGPYTANAIATIAFGQPGAVVDGNIERIAARYFALNDPLPAAKKKIHKAAESFYKGLKSRHGDLAQGLMDLGAIVCIPASPRCHECPVSKGCEGRKSGIEASLPARTKKTKQRREGIVYFINNNKKQILLQRRPQSGLLGGMNGLPGSGWDGSGDEILKLIGDISPSGIEINHVFTHFELRLKICTANFAAKKRLPSGYFWCNADELENAGLPSVFQKSVRAYANVVKNSAKVYN